MKRNADIGFFMNPSKLKHIHHRDTEGTERLRNCAFQAQKTRSVISVPRAKRVVKKRAILNGEF
jgi:hypothetical protein